MLLDDFHDASVWKASASDQVKASVRRDRDGSLCLDHDFAGVSGYAVMRRALPVDWPAHFDLVARIKGSGATNDLQVKLVDASGDNVWWRNRPNFSLPAKLTDLKIHSRQIDFAWGPSADKTLRQTRFIEFVIAVGREGGKGSLCVARLTMTERAPPPAAWPDPIQTRTKDTFTLDYGVAREFNGLALRWPAATRGLDYDVLTSDEGTRWRKLRQMRGSNGGLDALFLPDSEARLVRVQVLRGNALPMVHLKSASDWPNFNATLNSRAAALPRGQMPRTFLAEQNYWTLVGVDGGGERSGLISEDGAIEVGRGGFSVEPVVQLADGRRITWADVSTTQTLQDGYLPIPAVHWRHGAFAMDIEATADGPRDAPQLLARYVLRNTGSAPQTYTLLLAVRPWQVNPPQQFLATQGGASAIRHLAWDGQYLKLDQRTDLRFTQPPQHVTALSLDGGASLDALTQAAALKSLTDRQAHASGALQFQIRLAPGASAVLGWSAPLADTSALQQAQGARAGIVESVSWKLTPTVLDQRFKASAKLWRERLNRVTYTVPADAQPIVNTLRTSLAHILMSRNGPALQPGTRSYARSWIRDGAMMVAGLVQLGEIDAAREFVDWYRDKVFASGKVPCCVDQRGADPVVENDSHGQYLYAVAEVWRHSHDTAFLQRHWATVQRVTAWIEAQRQSERTAANQTPERAHLFGLMPASISHEGYSDKAAYSYWDDFWTLRGYKDAALIAMALGQSDQATRWSQQRDEFERELVASINATAVRYQLSFIAGAADRGDFDATSTTMALNPAQAQNVLPPALLAGTFERYWQEMNARTEGRRVWIDYTPYELRTVGALVRLGQTERAHAMLAFFFKDQRPQGWNQWAEVVLPEYRKVRFLGDMPHAWVSSDYIRSALDLFAYERESERAIIIGAGWKPAWLQSEIAVQGLSTQFGPLSYRLQPTTQGWTLQVSGVDAAARLVWPESLALPKASHQGQPLQWQGRALVVPVGEKIDLVRQ
jgi:hypothetical protein